jgi:hypothetical protein
MKMTDRSNGGFAMASIIELVRPYLEQVLPKESDYAAGGRANLIVTLPKLKHFSHRKTITLVFDQHVIDEVLKAHADGDKSAAELVGNYLCDKLVALKAKWEIEGDLNVQMHFHVGSEALDTQR